MENINIRFAKQEDYEGVENIMKQVQDLHISWRPDIYKTCDTVLSQGAFLDAVSKEEIIVAEVGSEVVGILLFMHRHIESDKQVTRDVLFIDAMAVDEKYRGRGIGHKLFDFLKTIAKENAYDGIELQVNAKNTAAYEMYRNCGFTEKSINMELL